MGFLSSFKKKKFFFANFIAGKIQYWCIGGKYRIYVARHETDGKIR